MNHDYNLQIMRYHEHITTEIAMDHLLRFGEKLTFSQAIALCVTFVPTFRQLFWNDN